MLEILRGLQHFYMKFLASKMLYISVGPIYFTMNTLVKKLMSATPSLIIIRGIAGAGKSTLAKRILEHITAEHYEADMYFIRNGEYKFDASKLKDAHAWCKGRVRNALSSGKTVVVSNTFCTDAHVLPYMLLAPNHIVIQLDTDRGSIHAVPEATIDGMKKQLGDTRIPPHILVTEDGEVHYLRRW